MNVRSRLTSTLTGIGAIGLMMMLSGTAHAQVDTVTFGAMDLERLQQEDALRRHNANEIERFAQVNNVAISPNTHGVVEQLADGRMTWRLRIDSANAFNVNLGTLYDVPASTVLYLIDERGNAVYEPYTAANNEAHGEMWTPPVPGSAVEVYAEVDADEWDAFASGFQITSVNLGFKAISGIQEVDADVAGRATAACHVDVACAQADPWRTQVDGVGAYFIGGFGICSGGLINNTSQDGRPLFMTAYHCLDSVGFNVNSMVVAWNYQNSFCRTPGSSQSGQNGNGNFNDLTQGGAQLLMSHAASDWALVELNNPVNPSFGVTYLGWDRRSTARTPGVGIHHPGVEEKRISIENNTPFTDTVFFSGQGNISTLGVVWDQGGVEGGSSGSPYFNQDGRVIGTATAATFQSICFQQATFYGRMDIAWNGGGTPSTRLRDHLDPGNTGLAFIDELGSGPVVPAPGNFNLLTPGNGATDVEVPVTFDWSDSSDVETYRIRVLNLDTAVNEIDETVTSSQFTTSALAAGTNYRWSVVATNETDDTFGSPSFSNFLTASADVPCDGDVTGDGVVDGADLLEVVNNFGSNGSNGGDVTGDNAVDGADLLEVVNNFGATCP